MLPRMQRESVRKSEPGRRSFLKIGLGGTLMLAAGGGIFGWRFWSSG